MPSLLSCFCVHHRRHVFSSQKRHSRKKIINRNSDWMSDTSSDLYHRPLPEDRTTRSASQDSKTNDNEILARLLDRQASPRRRHVEDIFREEVPVIEPLPQLHSLNRCGPFQSVERMNGYVPKAVGQISASSALTGGKMDDFFSDCRLHPALGRFANSTEVMDTTLDFYTIDRNEKRPSIVKVGSSRDDLHLPPTPSHLQIEIENNTQTDDVMRGSVSSSSSSLEPSEDESFATGRLQSGFFFSVPPGSSHPNNDGDPSLGNLFHSDGDILY